MWLPWLGALAATAMESWMMVQSTRLRLWVQGRRAVTWELHERAMAAIRARDDAEVRRWEALWAQAHDQLMIDIGLQFRRWHPWLYTPWVLGSRYDEEW